MENTDKNTASYGANRGDWQFADDQQSQSYEEDDTIDIPSAEAVDSNGDDADESLYARDTDEDEDQDEDIIEDDDDEEDAASDWGTVDPQSGGLPDSNDPSGPGSAV